MKVAFIGLGIMGSRMAANLLKNAVDVTVYNRTRSAAEQLGEQGASVAESAQHAVREADIVFTMLSKPEVVEKVAFGNDGFVSAMPEGALWADSSTVDPMFSRRMSEQTREAGRRFIDAPVAGTLPHAENAELIFLVGGEKADHDAAEPLMGHMGRKTMYLGDTGAGSSFKMLVNLMLAQSMIVYSEAVLLGKSMGIDEELLYGVLPTLPVIAPFTQAKTGMMRSGEYEANFPLELMQKDLHLATLCAYKENQPMMMTNVAKEIYAQAVSAGLGRHDFGAVFKYLEDISEK